MRNFGLRVWVWVVLLMAPLSALASESKFHAIEGCWHGAGQETVIHIGSKPCPRIAIKYTVTPTGFKMQRLEMNCPSMSGSWDLKTLELRNNTELWGGPENDKKVLGWLEKGAYWFDEPVNALQFVEFKGTLSDDDRQLNWLESFTHNQKNYWKIEAKLTPIACDKIL